MLFSRITLCTVAFAVYQSVYFDAMASDFPGLDKDVPGFNNLPFDIPTGDAHKCYLILNEMSPYKGNIAAIEDFMSIFGGKYARSKAGYYFNIPSTDMYIYSKTSCIKSCEANIIIKSAYNIDSYRIKITKESFVEMYPSDDNWVNRFGFVIYTHSTDINNGNKEFYYKITKDAGKSGANINISYGMRTDKINYCSGV